jgi:lysyl-tRNA synthetase class 1
VGKKVNDPEGVAYLKRYVENWIDLGYVPREFVFKFSPKRIDRLNPDLAAFGEKLDQGMADERIHNLIYEVARERGVNPSDFFKALYSTLIDKESGPKLGRLIATIGADKIKQTLRDLYPA